MTTSTQSDAQLMRDVIGGNRDSLEKIIRIYGDDILTFIGRMVGDSHLRDDLFQEVFLAVWQRRHQYRYPLPVRPWLFGIAANKCYEHFRRHHKHREVSIVDEVLTAAPIDSDPLIDAENHAMLLAAIAELPVQQRMVVNMRTAHQMSYTEIAVALDRTEATVRSHMHLALGQLRSVLQVRLQGMD